MLQIDGLDEGLEIFKCLGSEVRMGIVEQLAQNDGMNLNELASALKLTNGALTSHIRKLEECGIIQVTSAHTGRGTQKICSLNVDQLLLNVYPAVEERSTKVYETSVRIGQFSDYSVKPSCGIAGADALIGTEDDPRCFSWPERLEAEMIWLHDGFLEYRIPNLLPEKQCIVQVTLSFELIAADTGPDGMTQSDVSFFLNGRDVGHWVTFPDTDRTRGIHTPAWWDRKVRQHGFLKMLVINQGGAFLDGVKIADTGIDFPFLDDAGEMKLRLEAHPKEGSEGGLAVFGSGFGNYRQDIHARVHYMPEEILNG